MKSYNGKIYTNFYNNKISKEGSQCISLSVLLVEYKKNFFLRKYKKFFNLD